MNRSLKLSMLIALALGSTQAAAVELGQVQVKSALGQPLLVEIPVTRATRAELQSLSAQLALNEAFAKAGGERPTVPLQFNVVDENGHKVIRITSNVAVDDPYLDLLVEVSSSSGSNLREFAILLDPPGRQAQAPVSSTPERRQAAAGGTSAAASQTGTAAAGRPAPSVRHAAAETRSGQFGPVEKGATLSHVATETAPAGVDTNQMMMALKAANPDAFYRDNINALKAGAILRVPSRDDALSTSVAAALAAVRQQNSDWRNGTASAPIAVAAGGTRTGASVAPTANSHADKLALVPPGSEGQSAGGGNGKNGSSASARQDLQRSQEALASLQQQSGELKSRLKDLEDLNSKNQRLLSLKDDEIADLQKKLAEARKAAGTPAVPGTPAAPIAKVAPAAAKPEQPAAAGSTRQTTPAAPALAAASTAAKPAAPASSSTAAHAAVVTTPLKTTPAKPVARPPHRAPAPAPAEQPWYMQTWAWGAGGAVIVLLLLGLLARRGKSGGKSANAMSPTAPRGSLADRFGTVDDESLGLGSDPDQDELLDQLAEQPDDIGLHLELVSLYYTRRDVEHFEAAAEAMHAHITDPDQPEWQDVVHMGEDLVPGHPLFAQAAIPSSTHDEQSPLHHFDLDSYGAAPVEPEVAAPAKSAPPPLPSKVSEYHFDFDLTPAHHAEAAAGVVPAAKQAVEEEPTSTWHFDEPAEAQPAAHVDQVDHDDFGELHDDPVDTKLDLARAYLDMGDPEGARAMLEEAMHEGTQIQKDVAKSLLAKLH
ncbi:fimbrial protein FimV [Dyella jejuensis]|uniref:Fimbrial protein FimV n=1 Tax=Dyella jejuensis TaxID=1432009 RepID=A0ABW8JDQ7_9GAMM